MRKQSKSIVGLVAGIGVLLAAAVFTGAQTDIVASRITQAIDPANLTTLRGNTHPYAQPQFDRGAAPASLPMQRMLLVLQRSAQQESALDALLQQQQDASSPNYHHWLTPQQFGQQFGPSDQDIQTITSWLQSQGFQVNRVSNGRTVIEFSGTAGEVQSAFHTAIHQYQISGESHWANSSDPRIPTALAPVVSGISSLNDFGRKPMYRLLGPVSKAKSTGQWIPQFTLGQCGLKGVQSTCYGVAPYDFATIYNVQSLWNASPATDGTGVTIAIVGETDVQASDFTSFRTFFGLPSGTLNIIHDGPDPGIIADEPEADLDVEWSGAVAKGATIDLVVSAPTETTSGVDLSAQYIVDNNLAPVMSESYGGCELGLGAAGNTFYSQLWQQAAAQGISVFVSAGDNGSAGCDNFNAQTPAPARYGLQVNGISSTPYNVSVGGTDFFDWRTASTYWNSTNTAKFASAKGYIPETPWNDSCTNPVFGALLGLSSNAEANCNNPQVVQNGFINVVGGSGGKSDCTNPSGSTPSSCSGGYAKPGWQSGTGVPSDGLRDLPDVSLFAAIGGPSGSFYVMCEADAIPGATSCSPSDPNTEFLAIGGTSASSPAMAGIMALIDQKYGSQGNPNYIFYKLAAKSGNTCSSATAALTSTTCIFYDIAPESVNGNSATGTNAVPCATGSTSDCVTSAAGDLYGVLSGYNVTAGYDQATGLGSVNAANLVNNWTSIKLSPSSTTLTLTPPSGGSLSNLTHGQSVGFSMNVSAVAPATGTPSGTVALMADTGSNGQEGVQSVTLDSSGDGSGSTTSLPGGSYTVVGQYPGDGNFKSSVSPGTSVTVNPEASSVQLAYELINPSTGAITNPSATTAVFGTPSLLRVNVTSAAGDACANNSQGDSGCPTGSVTLSDSSNSLGTFALNALGYTEDPTIDLAGGTHVISAAYGGDSSYTAPASPGTDTLTITPAQAYLNISASNTSPTVGATVTLYANLFASGVYSSHGPSGNVTFSANGALMGSPVPLSGSASPTSGQAAGSTQTTWTATGHGSTNITATYSGDPSYNAPSTYFYVNVLYPSSTTVGAPSPSAAQYGQSVTLNAQVGSTQGAGTPFSGILYFLSNGIYLGSANVSASGAASFSTTGLQGGTDTITAQYYGDNNFASSTSSNNAIVTVTKGSTTTAVTSQSSAVTQGSNVTLTATVTASSAGPQLPSGTVQFFANGNSIGTATVAVYSNGQAQINTSSLPAGPNTITATYSGDGNYAASSASSGPTITVMSFAVSANPSTIGVSSPGQSGSTTLTFTSQSGFSSNGSVPLMATCSGLPSESSCSVSPSSINIPANGTATATLSIMTTAPSALFPGARNYWDNGDGHLLTGSTIFASALILLFCFGIVAGLREQRRRWALAFAAVALALVFANAGCGGGSSGGGGGNSNPGTPPGSQAIMVSFTINGVTQAIPLTVNVQ